MTKSNQEPKVPPVPIMQQFLKQMESELDKRRKEMPGLTPEMTTQVLNVAKQMTTEEMLSFVKQFNKEELDSEKQNEDLEKLVSKLIERFRLYENPSLRKDAKLYDGKIFPSQDELDPSFLETLSMGSNTETDLIVTTKNLVIRAAHLILKGYFKKNAVISYHETLGDRVESFVKSQYEKEAEKLGDTKEIAEGINLLDRPDGFFCLEGYDRPLMIYNYKASDELTEDDYNWLDHYCTTCEDANISAAEMLFDDSKIPEDENNSSLIKFRKLFLDVFSNTTKYGTDYACVSFGRCLLLLLTPQDDLNTLNYRASFIRDYESWISAMKMLLFLLLASSTEILEKKKSGEFDKFDERYRLFKENVEAKSKGQRK